MCYPKCLAFISIALGLVLFSCTRDPEVVQNDPGAPQATLNITSRVSAELTIVSTDQTPGITYGAEIVKIVNGEESEEKLSFETVELDENHSYTWITSDLQPGMTYSARTYISNGRNRKYSGKKTATTPSTSKATLSDVTLVGDMLTAHVVDNGGRQIEDMGFIAGESAERKELIRKEKKQATVVNGNSFSLPLNAFRGGRTYYIIAYATDSQEDSGYSNTPFETWFALPVETITIDMSEAKVEEGGTITLKVSIQPEDATDQTITWTTSDAEVATVEDGIVTAIKEGTAVITATVGGKTASCTVTVAKKYIPVTSISLNPTSLEMVKGETATLTASIEPEDATDKTISWKSSDVEVATVEDGTVTAIKEGTAIITVDAGGKSATCEVTVKKKVIAVTLIVLNATEHTMEEGDTYKLEAIVFPEDATDKTISWKTSDSSVTNVEDGTVTAIKEGKATITATSGDKSATCAVTVKKKEIAVTSITLNETSLTLDIGQSFELVATVLPEDATNKTVTWASDNPDIVSVANGMVTALKAGGTTVYAAAGGKMATCTVTVREETILVKSITIDESSLTLKIGDTHTLTASVDPENATERDNIEWESSNPSVASVSDDGAVTAIMEGSATITASAGGKSATCGVTVTASSVEGIPITSEYFPDPYFLSYIKSKGYDTDDDGFLSDDEIAVITQMTVGESDYFRNTTSIVGIEYFTALVSLNCAYCQLTSLDIHQNVSLKRLNCNSNPLNTLDLSYCQSIEEVNCSNDHLTSLDLTSCSLTTLDCSFNLLTSLDLSTCSSLSSLDCSWNQLTSLNVTSCQSLKIITCKENQLTGIDLSSCFSLEQLICNSNQLTSLDMSSCSPITWIDCSSNKLTSINLSSCSSLATLTCSKNQLTSLDLNSCSSLKLIHCYNNLLSTLDVSNCMGLYRLWCYENPYLNEIWLKTGQTITQFLYDTDVATIYYKE